MKKPKAVSSAEKFPIMTQKPSENAYLIGHISPQEKCAGEISIFAPDGIFEMLELRIGSCTFHFKLLVG